MQSYSKPAVTLLPPTLTIISPPSGQPREFSAEYIACAKELLSSEGPIYRPSTSCMEPGPESNRSWPVPSILRRRRRGDSQEPSNRQETGSGQSLVVLDSPSGSPWNIRRTVSAASPSTTAVPQDSSPASSSPMNRRPSRLSSLIRRHQTSREEESRQETLLYHSQESYIPFQYPTQPPHSAPSRITQFPAVSSASTISPPSSDQSAIRAYSTMVFSPVGNNPYDSWNNGARPHTISSSPTTYMTDSNFNMPLPTRGTSHSSAPAVSSSSEDQRAFGGIARIDTEPEAFTSPSDFALFAEATSSLNILSPSPSAPSRLSIPLPTVRASSVPPFSHSSIISTNPTTSTTTTTNINQPASYSSSVGGQQQRAGHVSSSSTSSLSQPLSRSHLLAEALVAVGSDSSDAGSEDELPDYATSQAEASALRRREATQRAMQLEQQWRRGLEERWKRGRRRGG